MDATMTNHNNAPASRAPLLAVMLALAVAGGWIATSSAYAGSWMEVSCVNPSQSAAPSDLLAHYRGHWEPFRTPRTDAAGRFTVIDQFEGARGRFPFRAEVPPSQADFSFGRGLSEVVYVATN
jgi:hypothetical protein